MESNIPAFNKKKKNTGRKKELRKEINKALGAVHTTTDKVQNAALFLRLGLSSTLIRHENGAFKPETFEDVGFGF